ncbi:MAG: MFS transporter [Promethearchaeota archaeon]
MKNKMANEKKIETFDREITDKVSIKAKVAYGTTNAANGLLSGIAFSSIDLFYTKFFNLDPKSIAWSWILFIVWNAVNDPLLGILEDKTHTKIGRRIPYLRYGGPFYAIAFILIWFPFFEPGNSNLIWNHLLMLFIFDTIYSMLGLITYSLPAEMALSSKERTNILIYSTVIGSIGMIGSIVLPIKFLKGDNPDLSLFREWMIVLAIISGFIISKLFYKRKQMGTRRRIVGLYREYY